MRNILYYGLYGSLESLFPGESRRRYIGYAAKKGDSSVKRASSSRKAWICTLVVVAALAGGWSAEASEPTLLACISKAAPSEPLSSEVPVLSLEGLDQPMASAIRASDTCWPSLGGICVSGVPYTQCRNDCNLRYNTCTSTAGCSQEECADFRGLCYECCW